MSLLPLEGSLLKPGGVKLVSPPHEKLPRGGHVGSKAQKLLSAATRVHISSSSALLLPKFSNFLYSLKLTLLLWKNTDKASFFGAFHVDQKICPGYRTDHKAHVSSKLGRKRRVGSGAQTW